MQIDTTRLQGHTDMHSIPADPQRRTQWIISELKLAGSSLATIAKDLRCTRQAGAHALRMGSIRWEAAIAEVLSRPVQELFPDRYTREGTRLLRSRRSQEVGQTQAA